MVFTLLQKYKQLKEQRYGKKFRDKDIEFQQGYD